MLGKHFKVFFCFAAFQSYGFGDNCDITALVDKIQITLKKHNEKAVDWGLILANQVFDASMPGDAIPIYLELLKCSQDKEQRESIQGYLLRAYISNKNYQEAVDLNKEILSNGIDKQNALFIVKMARDAASHSQSDVSANLFFEAIANDPSLRPVVMYELAEQLSFAGKATEAIPLYQELLATHLKPEDEKGVRKSLLRAYMWAWQYDDAIKEFDKGPQEEKKSEFILKLARHAAENNQHGRAIELFNLAIENDPSLKPVVMYELAEQLSFAGKASEAIPLYQELLATQLKPEDEKGVRKSLLKAYMSAWQYDNAIKEFDKGPQEEKKSEFILKLARLAAERNQHKESIELFNLAIENDPSLKPVVMYELAKELTSDSRGKEATPLFKELLQTNLTPEQRAEVEKALKKAEEGSDCADKEYKKGEKLEKAMQIFQAKRAFYNSVHCDPKNAGYLENYAWFLHNYGFFEEAVHYFSLFLPKAKDPQLIYQVLGWDSRAFGRYCESLSFFNQFLPISCYQTHPAHAFKRVSIWQDNDSRKKIRKQRLLLCGNNSLKNKKELFETYSYSNNEDLAICLAPEILKEDPNALKIQLTYADLLFKTERIQAAIYQYRDLIKKAPNSAFLYLKLGGVYENSGNISDAKCAYQTAYQLEQTPETIRAWSRICARLRCYQTPCVYPQCSSLDSMLTTAENYFYRKQYAKASCEYEKILKAYPFNEDALFGLMKSSKYTGSMRGTRLSYARWDLIHFSNNYHEQLMNYYRPTEVILGAQTYGNSATVSICSAGLWLNFYAGCDTRATLGNYVTKFNEVGYKSVGRNSAFLRLSKLVSEKLELQGDFICNSYIDAQRITHSEPQEMLRTVKSPLFVREMKFYPKEVERRLLRPNHYFVSNKTRSFTNLNCHIRGNYRIKDTLRTSLGYAHYDIIDTQAPFDDPIYNYSNQIASILLNIKTNDIFGSVSCDVKSFHFDAGFVVGKYTDGNEKQVRTFSVSCPLGILPSTSLSYNYFFLSFSKRASDFILNDTVTLAYWDPKNFETHLLNLYSELDFTRRLKAATQLGMLYTPKSRSVGYSATLDLDYKFSDRVSVLIDAAYFYQTRSLLRFSITGPYDAYQTSAKLIWSF